MSRFEIKGSPVSVVYGQDDSSGIFLSVSDERLKTDDEVTKQMGLKDGSGCYLNLYTGAHGLGLKVSKEVIQVYLKRYGVTDEQIKPLLEPPRKPEIERKCLVCTEMTNKYCQKCKASFYCGASCQKTDWDVHKWFCSQLPFPKAPKTASGKTVRAIYFAEGDSTPTIVNVPVRRQPFEGHVLEILVTDKWVTETGHTVMNFNPLKNSPLDKTLEFVHRDNFFGDGSKENKTVSKFMNARQVHNWKGPMLVCKFDGLYGLEVYGPKYTDIEVEDLTTVRDFFLAYPQYAV